MIEAYEVCEALESAGIFPELTRTELLPFGERAIGWLLRNIKEDADSNSPLALRVAQAAARYYIFTSRIGSTESYGSFKVGDMTLKRDIKNEIEIERRLYEEALCEGAKILKDGGFFFAAN